MLLNLNVQLALNSLNSYHFYHDEDDEDNGVVVDKENDLACTQINHELPDEVLNALEVLQTFITSYEI